MCRTTRTLRRAALDNGIDVYGFPLQHLELPGQWRVRHSARCAWSRKANLNDRTNAEMRPPQSGPVAPFVPSHRTG